MSSVMGSVTGAVIGFSLGHPLRRRNDRNGISPALVWSILGYSGGEDDSVQDQDFHGNRDWRSGRLTVERVRADNVQELSVRRRHPIHRRIFSTGYSRASADRRQ